MTKKPILLDDTDNEVASPEERRLAERRQILMLGAAGLPMMLSLKASAREVLVSQLNCVIDFSSRLRILVDCDGRAWVGTDNIEYVDGQGFKVDDIESFKNNASFTFPAGDVPSTWLPETCPIEECSNGDDDDDDDDYDFDFESASTELDELMRTSLPVQADGIMLAPKDKDKDKGKDDDDDDDDCDEEWIDSGYAFYKYGQNFSISPADHIDGSSWSPKSNKRGLFITLSLVYESRHGDTPGWPGISCIVSIVNYLGT